MKFKCRIGLHDWPKWESDGSWILTKRPDPYLYWIKFETQKEKYIRKCNCCGKPQSKFID